MRFLFRILQQFYDRLRIQTAAAGYVGPCIDIKIGFFINFPGFGEPPPEIQILIAVNQTFKNLAFDFAAGTVGG